MSSDRVSSFTSDQTRVFRQAVELSKAQPDGFTLEQLADRLDCSIEAARRWMTWLRSTDCFDPRNL
jgi:predicted ArsR family transcriptional regulator